jgi:polysaccharide deacetylase 2 family uncharacterized protein YibQ
MTRRAGPGRAWKALAVFWLLVLAGGAGTALVLQQMGAPEPARPEPSRGAGAAGLPPLQPAAPVPPPAPTSPAAPPPALAPQPPAPASGAPASPAPAALAPVPAAPPRPAPAGEAAAPSGAVPPSPVPSAATAPMALPEAAPVAAPDSPPAPPAVLPPLGLPDAPLPPPLPDRGQNPADHRPIPAPDPALLETSPYGPLPRIGPDGRQPRQAYARPAPPASGRPRIALAIGGFGLSPGRSQEAIRRLPPEAALGFSPLAARPDRLLEQVRARGMEVLLALPGDASGAEGTDLVLRPGLAEEDAAERLSQSLARFAGYVGAIGPALPRTERAPLASALQIQLRQRGLLYLDPQPGAPQPAQAWGRSADLVLDEPLTRGEVERRLAELEALALQRGSALGVAADPAPLLVDRILAWAAGLHARGLDLVPVSALAAPPAALSPHSAAR